MGETVPLEIPPGVVKTRTGEGAAGRWHDALNARFVAGKPEKRKGFSQLNTTLLDGIARGMDAWNTTRGQPLYAVGTNTKLYGSTDGADVIDITPLRYQLAFDDELSIASGFGAITAETDPTSTGTLSNPFTTVNLSTTVTVDHPSHSHATGDLVFFSGASAVGGITISGVYTITSTGAGTYTIVHSVAASSSTSGGGLVSYAWPRWAIGQKFLIRGNSFQGGSNIGGVFLEDEYEVVKVIDGDSYIIYPTRDRVVLGANPISTTNLSTTVTVTHVAHGHSVGDSVWLHGPVTVGGIVINGEYIITMIVDADHYQFTATAATSTTTGGTGINESWAEPATSTVVLGGGVVPYMIRLTNPFATTNLSTTVTVTHADHGAQPGDIIYIDGAAAVAGITIDGEYAIDLVVDEDSYTITHSVAANATTTGGGSDVVIEYEITAGLSSGFVSDRDYGEGDYGADLYGDVSSADDPTYFEPRSWAIDRVGEDAIASYLGGSIYYWDSSTGGRADRIPNAPDRLRYAFMTEERFLHALGIDGDSMLFGWSAREQFDDWSPDELDNGNRRRLHTGSVLVAGTRVFKGVNLIWSDTACFTHLFVGGRYVYKTELDGLGAGLLGPQGFAVTPIGVLWMGPNNFYIWNGSTQQAPNSHTIEAWVYETLDHDQRGKVFAHYDPMNHSVDFYFPGSGSAEPNLYVTVSLHDWTWINGEETRTTGAAFDKAPQHPLRTGTNGKVYKHEDGLDADGVSNPSYITLAPYTLKDWSELTGFDPDFKRQTGDVSIEVSTYDRNPSNIIDLETEVATTTDEMVDFRVSGRQIGLTLSQDALGGDWALDTPKIEVKRQGRRR